MEEVGPKTPRLARQLEPIEHRQHLLQPNAKLKAREVGAEAEMGAPEAESQVPVRAAADIETVRVRELIPVPIT